MKDLILYDGVCGLCDRLIQFLLKRDSRNRFLFAALQKPAAHAALSTFGRSAEQIDSVYVITDYGAPSAKLFDKGRAVLHVLGSLGGPWTLFKLFAVVPPWLLDRAYDFVAKRRHLWFGRYEACPLPPSGYQEKFLDE